MLFPNHHFNLIFNYAYWTIIIRINYYYFSNKVEQFMNIFFFLFQLYFLDNTAFSINKIFFIQYISTAYFSQIVYACIHMRAYKARMCIFSVWSPNSLVCLMYKRKHTHTRKYAASPVFACLTFFVTGFFMPLNRKVKSYSKYIIKIKNNYSL